MPDKSIYHAYLNLKKVALHVYQQNLKDFTKLQTLIPHHSGAMNEKENVGISMSKKLPKYIKECNEKKSTTRKTREDFVENKDIWSTDFFKDRHGKRIEPYKLAWGNFCRLSYHDQSNPPTAEMYIDFFEKRIEEGRSDASIYSSYTSLKKVNFG